LDSFDVQCESVIVSNLILGVVDNQATTTDEIEGVLVDLHGHGHADVLLPDVEEVFVGCVNFVTAACNYDVGARVFGVVRMVVWVVPDELDARVKVAYHRSRRRIIDE